MYICIYYIVYILQYYIYIIYMYSILIHRNRSYIVVLYRLSISYALCVPIESTGSIPRFM